MSIILFLLRGLSPANGPMSPVLGPPSVCSRSIVPLARRLSDSALRSEAYLSPERFFSGEIWRVLTPGAGGSLRLRAPLFPSQPTSGSCRREVRPPRPSFRSGNFPTFARSAEPARNQRRVDTGVEASAGRPAIVNAFQLVSHVNHRFRSMALKSWHLPVQPTGLEPMEFDP